MVQWRTGTQVKGDSQVDALTTEAVSEVRAEAGDAVPFCLHARLTTTTTTATLLLHSLPLLQTHNRRGVACCCSSACIRSPLPLPPLLPLSPTITTVDAAAATCFRAVTQCTLIQRRPSVAWSAVVGRNRKSRGHALAMKGKRGDEKAQLQ